MSHHAGHAGQHVGEMVATVFLTVVAFVAAVVLIFFAMMWGAGDGNNWGILLGVLAPIAITILGSIFAVVQLVGLRRRSRGPSSEFR